MDDRVGLKIIASAEVEPALVDLIEKKYPTSVYMRSDDATMVMVNVLALRRDQLVPEVEQLLVETFPCHTPWLMLIRREKWGGATERMSPK